MSFFSPASITMPSGQYYIGDLCYVLNDRWSQVCDQTIEGRSVKEGKFTLPDGTEFVLFSTAYGDGTYHANGTDIGVDSGSIGCVLLSDITDNAENDTNLGVIIDFKDVFECSTDKGLMEFGHVVVNTRHVEEDYDEGDWDDGWGNDEG